MPRGCKPNANSYGYSYGGKSYAYGYSYSYGNCDDASSIAYAYGNCDGHNHTEAYADTKAAAHAVAAPNALRMKDPDSRVIGDQ